ncbi:MAG: trypsin-like peptidase domain-containing protein, partial [Candidatus Izemoplasmatales bacterium]|nr:trypsin-like peptidase domain-containing protein [Candidatus Izemoplasmatales bacterium]
DIQDSLSKTNVMIQLKISESTMEVGSGTIIDVDDDFYYVITNEHVIRSMGVAISYKVITSDGIQSLFELLHHDAIKDLAIIRFPKESRSNITPIAFSNMESEIDEFVISIGNPYGSMGAFTMGSISSYETLTILNQEAISHTAVLARGSSGGALVNIRGQLLGINTWGTNSVFYAIPLRVILTFLASTTY